MKTGKTLTELAAEIERQQANKKDFVADTATHMAMTAESNQLVVGGEKDGGNWDVKDLAHNQIATHAAIPQKYYDKMRKEEPRLLANNVNTWFKKYPARRLVRVLDNNVRAFLSDKYRPLENTDLAEAVLPSLLELKLEIMSCEITDRHLYIKAVDQSIKADIPHGHKLGDGSHKFFRTNSPAIIISNSEVGCGRLVIDYGVFDHVCTNLAATASAGMKRTHVGSRLEAGENFEAVLTDETRAAKDKAMWLEARDIVKAAFDVARFEAYCAKLRGMTDVAIEGDPVKVVDFAARRFGFGEGVGQSVLKHLIEGADLTQFGLYNAFTRAAQDQDDYEVATDLEYTGGKIVDLTKAEWKQINAATGKVPALAEAA